MISTTSTTSTTARERANEFTLIVFLSTVVMLFAALTSAYLIRRSGSDWQPVALPTIVWVNTFVLVASSITMELARRSSTRLWLIITTMLGVAFLAGQFLAWRALAARGIFLPTEPHSAFFYVLSAVHGVHVAGGLVALATVTAHNSRRNLCAVYWHFVDGTWLYLLAVLIFL